jgi:hypothetical protein
LTKSINAFPEIWEWDHTLVDLRISAADNYVERFKLGTVPITISPWFRGEDSRIIYRAKLVYNSDSWFQRTLILRLVVEKEKIKEVISEVF